MATLEEKIAERKKQAEDRNIIGKAQTVAEKLGVPMKLENDDAREAGYRYENQVLEVRSLRVHAYPTHGFNGRNFTSTYIKYQNQIKFEAEDDVIKSYIPGQWEKQLDNLYEKLTPLAVDKGGEGMKEEFERQQREKAAKFCL